MLFNNISFAYFFEYIVFTIFKSYRYQPRFFKNSSFDNTIGAIMSQAVFVPMTAVFITSFQLGWMVRVFFTLYFFFIERLFIKLDIFKPYWWKSLFTATLIPLYFSVSDYWQKKLDTKNRVVLFTTLFNTVIVVHANILYLLAFFRRIRFGLRQQTSIQQHFVISPLYSIVISLFISVTIRKDRKGTFLALSLGFNYLLQKLTILKNSLPYFGWFSLYFCMFSIGKKFKEIIYSK